MGVWQVAGFTACKTARKPPLSVCGEIAMNFVEESHRKTLEFLGVGNIECALDATLGLGRDALFAAGLLAPGGALYGFDVQQEAVNKSLDLLRKAGFAGGNAGGHIEINFFNASHADMKDFIPQSRVGKIGVVFFNLGWMPGSDKSVKTLPLGTLKALEVSLDLIGCCRCALSVLSYTGHPGGNDEFAVVSDFFAGRVGKFELIRDNSNPKSPALFWAGLNG